MQLRHGLHLAYCTNVHRGETWAEVMANLESHVLAVRQRVAPGRPYAIGLRLGDAAALELSGPAVLAAFRAWLEKHGCYVFTINGFPYGRFHGTRVKEQVYIPDWTTPERLAYTLRLFDILVQLLPEGVEGGVSTVPGSFKTFIKTESQVTTMVENLWSCVEHLAALRARTGRVLHLDLEPEPLCFLETSEETVRFFKQMRTCRPGDPRLDEHLRVNYDACHLAVEFEEPSAVVRRFRDQGVRIGKLHLSSALRVVPTPEARSALAPFTDDVYFHQVVARHVDGSLSRYQDLPDLLAELSTLTPPLALSGPRGSVFNPRPFSEWRIHYHIPLHSPPTEMFGTTQDHLLALMDVLAAEPELCQHLEMETYTWEVLPWALKQRSVVDQLVAEYQWALARLAERGLAGA